MTNEREDSTLSWSLVTSTDKSLEDYRYFWGDEYGWTALLPIAWKSLEVPGMEIRPILGESKGFSEIHRAASYWSVPIHLLGLGMGWTDIGKGLRVWREGGYRSGCHPILDFLLRSYGKDIRALEVYFGVSHRYEIYEALRDMSSFELDGKLPQVDTRQYLDWEREYMSEASDLGSTPCSMLLDGGDALHLESHVSDSFRPSQSALKEPTIRQIGTTMTFVATYPTYAGWGFHLARQLEFEQYEEDGFRLDLEIDVQLEGFGSLGRFMHHNESGRYFLFSDIHGAPSLQWDTHRWGNPI